MAADEGVEGLGGDLGSLPGGDGLGPGRDPGRDLGVEGPADGFAPDRVPLAVQVGHPGDRILPRLGPRLPPLLLQLADPVVAHQPIDRIAAAMLELAHRQALGDGLGHQLVGLVLERLLLRPREPVGLVGQHIGMTDPDVTVLERTEGFGHLLHRLTPLGRLRRLAVTQTGLRCGLLRVGPLALLLERVERAVTLANTPVSHDFTAPMSVLIASTASAGIASDLGLQTVGAGPRPPPDRRRRRRR